MPALDCLLTFLTVTEDGFMSALQTRTRNKASGEGQSSWDQSLTALLTAREVLAQKRAALTAAALRNVQEDLANLREDTYEAIGEFSAQNRETNRRLGALEGRVARVESANLGIEERVLEVHDEVLTVHDKTRDVQIQGLQYGEQLREHGRRHDTTEDLVKELFDRVASLEKEKKVIA